MTPLPRAIMAAIRHFRSDSPVDAAGFSGKNEPATDIPRMPRPISELSKCQCHTKFQAFVIFQTSGRDIQKCLRILEIRPLFRRDSLAKLPGLLPTYLLEID